MNSNGELLMYDGRETFVAPNSPDLRSARNRLVVVTSEYTWHEFPLPPGFAEEFENRAKAIDGSARLLRGLQAFARQKNIPEIAKWIDGNVPTAWLDGRD